MREKEVVPETVRDRHLDGDGLLTMLTLLEWEKIEKNSRTCLENIFLLPGRNVVLTVKFLLIAAIFRSQENVMGPENSVSTTETEAVIS